MASRCSDLSRSAVQRLIQEGQVLVDGQAARASQKVVAGERVSVEPLPSKPSSIERQRIPLDIVFEDDRLLVINKANGLTVHPAGTQRSGTLVNALLAHCGESLSGINGEERPGIVHRLDKDTSGLLVVAKDDVTHRHLSRQLEARTVERRYISLCWGHPKVDSGNSGAPSE